MRVCFWHSDKPRERILAEAFIKGVKRHGDTGYLRPLLPDKSVVAEDADVACMVGVKCKRSFDLHTKNGCHVLMFDKGYTRHTITGNVRAWEWWRIAVDAHHPTHYLSKIPPISDRFLALELELLPWTTEGSTVIFAGSSQKYHEFYGLPEPTEYAEKQIRKIRKATQRPIIYRPKPSWGDAVPIDGTQFITGGVIGDLLKTAHALVTHGSNSCFEALLFGVPSIVLGDGVAKSVSSNDIGLIETPRRATERERLDLLSRLAYCQFTLKEMAQGLAWEHTKVHIY